MKETIGMRIQMARKEKGITQSELADKLYVSAQAVSKWENDQASPDITMLNSLSEILDVSIDYLIKGEKKTETILNVDKKRSIEDLILKLRVVDEGAKVNLNVPMALFTIVKDLSPMISIGDKKTSDVIRNIDFNKIVEMVEKGVLGKLIDIEDEDGTIVEIYVE